MVAMRRGLAAMRLQISFYFVQCENVLHLFPGFSTFAFCCLQTFNMFFLFLCAGFLFSYGHCIVWLAVCVCVHSFVRFKWIFFTLDAKRTTLLCSTYGGNCLHAHMYDMMYEDVDPGGYNTFPNPL